MVTELGGSVFEITHDLVGDLFRAKNAGVTLSHIRYLIFVSSCLLISHYLFISIH
jgi:hypothetical protein